MLSESETKSVGPNFQIHHYDNVTSYQRVRLHPYDNLKNPSSSTIGHSALLFHLYWVQGKKALQVWTLWEGWDRGETQTQFLVLVRKVLKMCPVYTGRKCECRLWCPEWRFHHCKIMMIDTSAWSIRDQKLSDYNCLLYMLQAQYWVELTMIKCLILDDPLRLITLLSSQTPFSCQCHCVTPP